MGMGIPDEVQGRVGEPKELEGLSDDDLKAVLKEYYDRWVAAESSKYDIGRDVHIKDMQIHDLEMEVSDMRGKFILPKLKKVHNKINGRRRIKAIILSIRLSFYPNYHQQNHEEKDSSFKGQISSVITKNSSLSSLQQWAPSQAHLRAALAVLTTCPF